MYHSGMPLSKACHEWNIKKQHENCTVHKMQCAQFLNSATNETGTTNSLPHSKDSQ